MKTHRFSLPGSALALGILLTMCIAVAGLFQGYQMVGKPFAGFGMEFSFLIFPVEIQDWTGTKTNVQSYKQIRQVDGRTFANTHDLQLYLKRLPPGTNVTYTMQNDDAAYRLTIPTMRFRLSDYLRIFGMNAGVAFLYAVLTLYILWRRRRIQHAGLLLFLTYSFMAVYAMRASYDYLHQYLSLALVAFCAFPVSMFMLGSHLAKTRRTGRQLLLVEKLNLGLGAGLALALAGMAAYLAPAPYQHGTVLRLFVQLYEILVGYYLVNILGFIGLVLWRTLRRGADELKNWQARIILIGSLVSFMPYLTMMGAFWIFSSPWSLPSELMATNTYLFVLFVAFALLQDEAVALEALFKKTILYYSLLCLFSLAYVVMYRVITVLLEATRIVVGHEQIPLIAGFAAFVLVSTFNNRLQNLISGIFYRQRKQLKQQYEAYVQNSTSTLDPQKQVGLGLQFLQQAFNPQNLALYLSPNLQTQGPHSYSRYFVQAEAYPERIVLADARLESPADLQAFRERFGFDQELILPLYKNEVLLGLFVLDKKSGGLGYFSEDLEMLQQFSFYFATGFYVACQNQISLAAQHRTESAKRMEVLGTLASGVAHDFNNLLSTIVMSVGLMKYLSEDPQILERLQVIQHSAEKGAEITKALRDYTSALPPAQAISLREVLNDTADQLSERLPAGVSLDLHLPPATWLVLADAEQLQRALLELASNAQLAMDGQGTLTIDVCLQEAPNLNASLAEPNQAQLEIRVGDTGIGIPASIADRVYDPFFSAWPASSGLGLGLSIARQIVQSHNGQLSFRSEENRGTLFSLLLPLATAPFSHPLPAPRENLRPATAASLILVIDDERPLRQLLAEVLNREGYAVLDAENGDQGLKLFQAHLPNLQLVILDMDMPDFDGRYFLASLREQELLERVPILIASGNLSRAEARHLREQGFGLLPKPYAIEDLREQLHQLQASLNS